VTRTNAKSEDAQRALQLVETLQKRFADKLGAIAGEELQLIDWLRDGGAHGGGARYVAVETLVFDRAAINVSQVHYDDMPDKRLSSASAISTIIHPKNPSAPSVHMHFSYTEMRDGGGYWRLMADLNPSNPDDGDKARFIAALKAADPEHYEEAAAQGDRYFAIPALGRTRGVTHYYLEAFTTGDLDRDAELTRTVAEAGIDTYCAIFEEAIQRDFSAEAEAAQLAYHTLYLFQVLTLDRGTTSGLLVHDQNDVGIMGSLPSHVDRDLLGSWAEKVPAPQGDLVRGLAAAIPEDGHVTEPARAALAQVVRAHYTKNPEALQLQASGNVVPPTVANHQ
jgi:coproporphyrinogen III oxidase